MTVGPIQLLMVGFGTNAEFHGEILDELERLVGRGMIRVIDLQFVMKTAGDEIVAMETSSLSDEEAAEFGAVIGGLIGLAQGGVEGALAGAEIGALTMANREYGLTVDDIADIAASLEVGEAAGILLFEHTWAAGLRDAIRRAGGVPLMQGFLTPEVLLMVGAEVERIVEAERTIELAEAVQGAAVLDALATIEAAEEIKAVVVADVVRTLIVAGLIEDSAAQDAVDALAMAGLIEAKAIEEAAEVVAAMEAEVASANERMSATGINP